MQDRKEWIWRWNAMGKIGGKNVQWGGREGGDGEMFFFRLRRTPRILCECVDEDELIKIGNGIAFWASSELNRIELEDEHLRSTADNKSAREILKRFCHSPRTFFGCTDEVKGMLRHNADPIRHPPSRLLSGVNVLRLIAQQEPVKILSFSTAFGLRHREALWTNEKEFFASKKGNQTDWYHFNLSTAART